MNRLQELEELLSAMTRSEKAQVLQWVARDLGDAFPGIESIPDVCGGEPCVVRTRIPGWVLVELSRLRRDFSDRINKPALAQALEARDKPLPYVGQSLVDCRRARAGLSEKWDFLYY